MECFLISKESEPVTGPVSVPVSVPIELNEPNQPLSGRVSQATIKGGDGKVLRMFLRCVLYGRFAFVGVRSKIINLAFYII